MSSHRLTRREILQKDEFVTGVERVAQWLESRWKTLAWIVGGAVAAAIVFGLVAMWMGSRNAASERMLGEAMTTLQAPLLAPGQLVGALGETGYATTSERDARALEQIDDVLEAYPMSRSATLASYLKGATLLRLDRPDEARTALQAFVSDNPSSDLVPLARRALAQAELLAGNPDEGLTILQGLVDEPTIMLPVDAALMELGRAQEEAGRGAEAAETYRRIANEHPESVYAGEAAQAVARLTAAGVVPRA